MIDLVRIYVLWAPGSAEGAHVAELISRHFDGIGMERDGVAHRIPVRFRSEPWEPAGSHPRPIDLGQAAHNVIVFLHDLYSHLARDVWNTYVGDVRTAMEIRGEADLYVPFGSPGGHAFLSSDENLQYARRDRWQALPTIEAREARLLLHLLYAVREHLRGTLGRGEASERLFVSHAKADGDKTARAIVDYVNATDQDVPLQTFYDAKELSPGDDFAAEFDTAIRGGTLLAIVSDVYDSRPWCVFELTTAKRARRPIVLADVGQVRTSRTYPYGANLPRVRITPKEGETTWVERLLVETLSEGLRCDIFEAQATRALALAEVDRSGALILPRPPELFDVVEAVPSLSLIVYPDPPISVLEREILERATALAPALRLATLSEVR
ncbi:toll/interleukin-1 receptor domain-containing protein [Methylobacterium sp. V23]|uniref:toll/interleukin-1 receptor domain-containing protein n=1 Tax=Methylobacterium sp. V23 TaxID=2044878 RepID=UPI000CDA2AF2|nr:toll/interleukin-1 receptor domain-containing protein [Methylobacterium sp. V23]POR40193.1 hypothetical protein CRT23_25270 [Methylobacterium sp. V23]